MSVKTAYDGGFNYGLAAATEKLAATYGINKTALLNDIRRQLGGQEPQPAVTGADVGLGAGSAAALGGGFGVSHLADKLKGLEGTQEAFRNAESMVPQSTIDKVLQASGGATSTSGNKALQQAVIDAGGGYEGLSKSVGGGGTSHRADKIIQAVLDQKARAEELAKAEGSMLHRAQGLGATGRGLGMVGRGLKGLGAVGAAGLLGKKLYDVATD